MVCSSSPRVKSSVLPTAHTSFPASDVTPVRKLFPFVDGSGFGLGTTFHEDPFQCSVSVLLPCDPTAHASVGEMATTPRRSLLDEPTLGLGRTDHRAPFHRSVRVLSVIPASRNPTAQASVPESAETAFNSLFNVPTLGLWEARQEVPSKCSISVLKALEDGPRNVPTAQASEAVSAETADSWLKSVLRLGVRWFVQMAPAAGRNEVADALTAPRTTTARQISATMVRRSSWLDVCML